MLFLVGENGSGSYDIYIDYVKAIGDRIHPNPIYSRSIPIGVIRSHVVCVNTHLFEEARRAFPRAVFFNINMEQMVLEPLRNKVIEFYSKHPTVIHIDYSQQNIDILCKELPFLRSIWIPQLPPVAEIRQPTVRPISVLFLGDITGPRYTFLNELGSKLGIQVYTFSGVAPPNTILVHNRLFGNVRDNVLRNSKIILNIPIYDTHTIFPSLRIHWALYQGCHVVTLPFLEEPSWESPSLRQGLHITTDFAATIREIANKPPPTLEESDYAFFEERIQALLKLL